jgi:hypothetical protein
MPDRAHTPVFNPGSPNWPKGTYLQPEQVAAVASMAGFKARALPTAVAISFAENTTHNTAATNHNTNGTWDVGLWQINSVHLSNKLNYEDLVDPAKNAEAAYGISTHGTNFWPWVTYQRNYYVAHLPAAHNAITAMNQKGGAAKVAGTIGDMSVIPGVHIPNPLSPLGDIGSALGAIGSFASDLPGLLIRFGKVLFGLALIVGGLFMITKTSPASVIPAGRIAKAAKGVRGAKAAEAVA